MLDRGAREKLRGKLYRSEIRFVVTSQALRRARRCCCECLTTFDIWAGLLFRRFRVSGAVLVAGCGHLRFRCARSERAMIRSGEPCQCREGSDGYASRGSEAPFHDLSSRATTRKVQPQSSRAAACVNRAVRNRRAFAITDTELRLIAAPAMIGLRRMPKMG